LGAKSLIHFYLGNYREQNINELNIDKIISINMGGCSFIDLHLKLTLSGAILSVNQYHLKNGI